MAEPNLVPSSLRSAMSCSTNADDESDSAAPITIASSMLFTDASFGDCAAHWHWSACRVQRQTQSCDGCRAPGSAASMQHKARVTVGPGLLIRGLDWQSDRHISKTVHGESSIRCNYLRR